MILAWLCHFSNDNYHFTSATAYGLFGPENIQELFNIYLVPLDANMPGVEGVKVFVLVLTFVNTQVCHLWLTFKHFIAYF